MATVNDILGIYRLLLIKGRMNMHEHDEIRAINEAKFEVWKILTSHEKRQNWFVKILENQSILTTQRVYNMPSDFAQMRQIEPTAPPGSLQVLFSREDLDSDRFQSQRKQVGGEVSEMIYTIIGAEPGQMVLASVPTTDLTVTYWYTHKLGDWTALTDNIDDLPRIAWLPIARYAAGMIILGSGAGVRFSDYRQMFQDEVIRMTQAAERDDSGTEAAAGFMEGAG